MYIYALVLCMYIWMLASQRNHVNACVSMSLPMFAMSVILYVLIYASVPLKWSLLVVGLPEYCLLLPTLPEFRTILPIVCVFEAFKSNIEHGRC
jgi:hypothetical protein